tara:strand:+ start:10945 stop:11349 length:405 start_codon:yes stop_codon:yes gene_type:complete
MKRAVLIRLIENKKQTLGRLFVFDGLDVDFECCTLELPYKANTRNVSCIPTGEYNVLPRTSKKFGDHYEIKDVQLRKFILIHPANYYTQLRGCIAVGHDFYDINGDGEHDLTYSRRTIKRLLAVAPEGLELIII